MSTIEKGDYYYFISDYENLSDQHSSYIKAIGGMNPFAETLPKLPNLLSKKFASGTLELSAVGVYIPQISSSKITKQFSRRRIIIKSLKVPKPVHIHPLLAEFAAKILYPPNYTCNFSSADDGGADIRNYVICEYRVHLHVQQTFERTS